MNSDGQKQDNTKEDQVTVTIYTSDKCAFCEPAIDTVKKAIDEVSSIGCKPHFIVSRVDPDQPSLNDREILALPTIAIGRYQLVGLPRVEEVEHLIHCAIMEASY
jgi:hypothetical protein